MIENCACHINPPCRECERSFECTECGDIFNSYNMSETTNICDDCFDRDKPKDSE